MGQEKGCERQRRRVWLLNFGLLSWWSNFSSLSRPSIYPFWPQKISTSSHHHGSMPDQTTENAIDHTVKKKLMLMFSSQNFIGPVASLKFDPQFAKKSATQTKSTRGKGCRIPNPIQIRSNEPKQVSRVKIVMRVFFLALLTTLREE